MLSTPQHSLTPTHSPICSFAQQIDDEHISKLKTELAKERKDKAKEASKKEGHYKANAQKEAKLDLDKAPKKRGHKMHVPSFHHKKKGEDIEEHKDDSELDKLRARLAKHKVLHVLMLLSTMPPPLFSLHPSFTHPTHTPLNPTRTPLTS